MKELFRCHDMIFSIGFRKSFFFALTLARLGAAAVAWQNPHEVHFKPADHVLGDVHPFFDKGICHLYYLKPGGFKVALARSSDLRRWEELQLEHLGPAPAQRMQPYYVLGVVRDPVAQVFRSYYGHTRGRMVSSVGTSLVQWSCATGDHDIPPAEDYVRRRDPFVFWNGEDHRYWCVMTTQMAGQPKRKAGAVTYATSTDFTHWENRGVLLNPGNIDEPECPQMFRLAARWYLLASIYDRAVGRPSYWVSDSASGPWKSEPAGVLDGKDLCAAQVAWDGARWVMFGWIPLTASKPGYQGWGGHLALPREVFVLPDGMLGTRLHGDVGRAIRGKPLLPALKGVLLLDGKANRRNFDLLPNDGRLDIELVLKSAQDSTQMGVVLDAKATDGGVAVTIDLAQHRLLIQGPGADVWSDLSIAAPVGQATLLRVIVEGDMVEVFLMDRYSLAARVPRRIEGGAVAVFADRGSVWLEGMRVYGL
jgi:hypothetical protein